MNKIYKVVWNKARNCYVVASEFAKNHQTGSSRIKAASVAAVMAATMLTIGTGVIYAAEVDDTKPKDPKETILFENTTDKTTQLNNPNLKHHHPGHPVDGHTDKCGELTYNTTLTIGDINKVVDKLVDNDTLLYNQGIQKVTMNNGTISLIRNDNTSVTNSIALTGNDSKIGEDTSVTVKVGNESQTFKTGSVVTAEKDANGNATKLTINGNSYGIKAGKHTTLVDGENTKATLVKDDATGTQYKVDVDLSKYAKTEDVAVVYNKNKTSLRSTNASVKDNSIALGEGASAVENSVAIGNGASVVDGSNGVSGVALGNKAHAGYKGTSLGSNAISGREGTTLVGANTNSGSLYTTVVGTDSVISTDGTEYKIANKSVNVQGAMTTAYGAYNNVVNNNKKVFSGVSNSVIGSVNTVKNSNGVTIQGTGNTVTDAYKDMEIGFRDLLDFKEGDYSSLSKKKSGAIAVVGGANTVSKQTDSTVIGYDNQLIGDEENISHDVFMAGSHNRLNNVSDSIVMGNDNKISDRSNVISFGHKNAITANNAVAIGNGAGVSVEGGVALGVGSVADRAAGKVVGYDPTTGKAYNIENGNALDYVWKATKGAVSVGSGRETRQITNVAAGAQDTDAVNVAQLKKVATEAGKHTQVTAGTNVGIVPGETEDGTHVYTVNADGTTVSGDSNVAVTAGKKDANNVTNYGVKLNKDLKGIESISNGDAKLTLGGFTTELTNGKGAAITLFGDTTTINNKVTVYKDGRIAGVAAGINDKDAVNVSQLKNSAWKLAANGVLTEAEDVKAGDYVDFSGDQNVSISKDAKGGVNTVKVELNKDLTGIETISNDGASLTLNGTATELTNGKGAAITLFGDTTTINNKVTVYKDGRIAGVAAGINDKDAVNVGQLNAVGATANKGWNLATNGVATEATNVKPGDFVDFSGDKNISVSHDGTKVKVELNKDIDVNSVQTNALNSKYNLSVGTMAENGIMPFLVNSTGAFYAANNNFSVDKDGKVIATAGEIGNVVLQNGVYTGNSALRDGELYVGDADGNYSQITTKGAKLGKVTVAEDGKISGVAAGEADTDAVNVSQLQKVSDTANAGWNLSTNGVATEATNVKPGDYVDFSGDKNISVSHDGTKVKVELNKDIDVNSVQTNALNSKYNLSVGTMAENGIMPFLVNSTGAFYAANNNFSVDKDGKVIATAGEIGNVVLQNGVYTGNSALRDGELYVGDASGNYSQITTTGAKLGQVTIAADGKISGVAAGVEKTDAVNVGQLKDYVAANDTHIKSGNYAVGEVTDSTGNKSQGVSMDIVNKEGKVTGTVTITDVAKASDVGDVNNIASDIKNQDGSHTTVVHAVNNLNNKLDTKVGDLQYSKVEKGDIADGDSTTTAIGKLDQKLTDVAATAAKHTKVEGSSNIIVTNTAKEGEAANYKVELKKDIDVDTVKATTVTTGQTVMNNDGVKVGKDVSVTATAVTAGQTSISNDGLKVNGKTYVSDSGLNANDQKITNVADGKVEKGSTDAVNGGQLYNETRVAKDGNFVKKSNTAGENLSALDNQVTANTESIYHMNGRISDLDNRVNKVGAGAAALAALHPLDFDPDAKWDFAAGYGNYRGANAAAVGAYYRPNEDTMFSVGGTFGNGENMVNAGVSFKLGSGSSHVSTSRVAMAKEIKELRGELEAMKSAMLDANAGKKIDTSKLQLFPDVPQNHWAYEYVAQLAGNGMIEGYPDGNFAGDRPMTRYEFAAILYRAMTKGAVLSDKILSEFSHELEYFTVDTIAKDKAGNPTIQRVRTVKENKNK